MALLAGGLQGLTQILFLSRQISTSDLQIETQAAANMLLNRDVWMIRRPRLPQEPPPQYEQSQADDPDSLANSEHPDPVIPDPEPDWLLDSDEEFAIALEIECSG